MANVPSRLSTLKYGLINRISRASCTVCMVALLPEPWKARSVGLMVELEEVPTGGVLGVMYVVAGWGDAMSAGK